jgi:hypothetical protein
MGVGRKRIINKKAGAHKAIPAVALSTQGHQPGRFI